MRVLHVLPTLAGGGAERFVSALLPSLTAAGARCGVMTVYPSAVPFEGEMRTRIDVLDVARSGRYDPKFFGRMVAGMRAWRPDVVHTHMHNGKYWGRLAAVVAGVPAIVHTVHNPCDRHRILGEPLVDRLLNAASAAIVTFSQSQRRFLCTLEGIAPDKVVVIPNGIRHPAPPPDGAAVRARERLGLREDEFVVFVLGTLYRPKNQRLALEALAATPASYRARLRLCIVGDGVDRDGLERSAASLGIDDRTRFLGHRSDAREILPAADLLFVPSLTEGMPLAMIEAMSAGVPVLSTPWIGASDLLEDGQLGELAPSWDPAAIADCFVRSMNGIAQARAKAARARVRARAEYDIAVTAKSYHRLYESLVSEREAA